MIIRHAEKPGASGDDDRGVSPTGEPDRHELTVTGWQRAGALVRFFAPSVGAPPPPLAVPAVLVASAAIPGSPSLRAQRTLAPLSRMLGLPIRCRHAEGEEHALAASLRAGATPALVCWHHKSIAPLVEALTDGAVAPRHWPDERFDLVWVLERGGAGRWTFAAVPQRLLPGDRDDTA